MRLDPDRDQLIFDVSPIAQFACSQQCTKRDVVSMIGRFYDPLGFLAPLIIRYKIFFQRLCESKMDWDETLSEELMRALVDDLQWSPSISIPRSYLAGIDGDQVTCTIWVL